MDCMQLLRLQVCDEAKEFIHVFMSVVTEKLLEKHQCPQKIKHDLSAKHQSCNFVYKTI